MGSSIGIFPRRGIVYVRVVPACVMPSAAPDETYLEGVFQIFAVAMLTDSIVV
jgi:hypothetical protein